MPVDDKISLMAAEAVAALREIVKNHPTTIGFSLQILELSNNGARYLLASDRNPGSTVPVEFTNDVVQEMLCEAIMWNRRIANGELPANMGVAPNPNLKGMN